MSIYIERNRPRLSLGILWLAFFCVAWGVLYRVETVERLLWVAGAGVAIALTISMLFSVPLRSQQPLTQLLKNDVRSFATAVFGAFVLVVLLAWLDFTLSGLTLLVASMLAKVELRIAGIRSWRAFWLTGAVSCGAVVCAVGARWGVLQASAPF
ncbi:MAG: hypothetical protein AAF685_12460 [Cyanobacteria bacterium P01_C01_bin.89]